MQSFASPHADMRAAPSPPQRFPPDVEAHVPSPPLREHRPGNGSSLFCKLHHTEPITISVVFASPSFYLHPLHFELSPKSTSS